MPPYGGTWYGDYDDYDEYGMSMEICILSTNAIFLSLVGICMLTKLIFFSKLIEKEVSQKEREREERGKRSDAKSVSFLAW